jgi:hypothetical protein
MPDNPKPRTREVTKAEWLALVRGFFGDDATLDEMWRIQVSRYQEISKIENGTEESR